jgi:asparagine synthase (glutamine-hydrolysing)
MCGIAGYVNLAGLDPALADSRAETALNRISRRGPDGRGKWSDGYCLFAHTRLAIIDLSEQANQPMQRDGLIIIYNGEIFNFAQIKSDLVRRGHEFRTSSDTEVLLAGWQEWGPDLLPRLVGMFAFAIWDSRSRTLHAARDRFGEKPFIYAGGPGYLAFGSDLIACEAMLGEMRPIDPAALRALFMLRFIPEPWSIAQNVYKLPPGHWLRFDHSGLTVQRWYDLTAQRPAAPVDRQSRELELRKRFDAAVRDRLVADVPVGVFLSSGIDSSLVAASVAASGAPLKTFTVGFENASDYYEERPLAAAIARHLGAEHTEISVSASRTAEVLDNVFLGLDEPFADASAVPTFLVSEATRGNVSVVLTGDGADEVFGGYRRYWSELYINRWNRVPAALRHVLTYMINRLPDSKDHPVSEAFRRAQRFVNTADSKAPNRQAAWMRLMSNSELDGLLGPSSAPALDLERRVAEFQAAARDVDAINAMLACDVAFELPGDMLVKVDRMSMTNALETRTPFLDQRVVEYSFAMPGREKLALVNGRPVGKQILRSAFRDRLPKEVFQRPKRGFEMPIETMLTTSAADRMAAAMNPAALRGQGLFNPTVVNRWWLDLSHRRRDTSWELWTLLAFQEWARLHRRPEAIR